MPAILCHPLLLLPSVFPSIRVFSNESALRIRWPKYGGFSFNSPSNEHPGLISFRMDWLALLADRGTLKSLLHASNLDWQSVSQLIMYMFQCYSLRSSLPRLLPQRPKVCSKHLWLFFCPTYRVIVPSQVWCVRQVLRAGALGWARRVGWGGRWKGDSGWGIHVNPWLIHIDVWQKPLQYYKVKERKKERKKVFSNTTVQKHQFFSAQLSL